MRMWFQKELKLVQPRKVQGQGGEGAKDEVVG